MDDTICAIATTSGVGAISIIRVSGSNAILLVNQIFSGNDLTKSESHTIHYGHIVHDSKTIDEVLIMLMKSPKTYTLEDTVEINCHGGINTTKKILEILLLIGCRLAEPGEFTKRAFLNGRINLLEAESVNDLIVSVTDASRTLAINNIDGLLTKKIRTIREKLVKLLANIEVNIDYPEYEDEVKITYNMLEENINFIKKELNTLLENSKNGRLIKEGINIAIIGKPNVGKSSILNTLLDEEKAIVTNIPGTTRDLVEGSITLNGVLINFVDTAGIRVTTDEVEKLGVDKSKKVATNADGIIFVINNNEAVSKEELDLLKSIKNKNLIIFVNKNDLESNLNLDDSFKNIIYGNTLTKDGLKELLDSIKTLFNLESIVNKDMSYLSNIRQIDLINRANIAIDSAKKGFIEQMPIDLIEIDIKNVWDLLGELIGESYSEELVDNIFSNFCLGK
ncbi:MAG: tRNA uridine-5-carboxymethylaminomethyl(34) synthesis GTPase MnmE [Bacilli bacterium]